MGEKRILKQDQQLKRKCLELLKNGIFCQSLMLQIF